MIPTPARIVIKCNSIVDNGAIEALYARAGFRTVCGPTLLCTSPP